MKILLLQSSVYLPSYGGGNKSNRLLLEALTKQGHKCWSISKSVNAQTVIDKSTEESVLQLRGIQSHASKTGVIEYNLQGVHVFSLDTNNHLLNTQQFIEQQCSLLQPNVLLVSDDKNADLLALALKLYPNTTVLIVHTNFHLPFGDEATETNHITAESYQRCKHILTSTKYSKEYLQKEAHIVSTYLPFPVFGDQPSKKSAQFRRGFIGMINPCAIKGIDIFIQLAKQFSHLNFLAVPTWGANSNDIQRLEQCDNISIMQPQDNIECILKHLSILIVPSLIHETFGYVTVEAMLRGIPVLASNLGGLRDAKLGVDYLLPVNPAVNHKGQKKILNQDITEWALALKTLTENQGHYEQCSKESYDAANDYVSKISISEFEHYLSRIKSI